MKSLNYEIARLFGVDTKQCTKVVITLEGNKPPVIEATYCVLPSSLKGALATHTSRYTLEKINDEPA